MSSDSKEATTSGIVLYGSSVPASVAVEKNLERVRFLLDNLCKGAFKEISVDLSPADKEYLHTHSKHETNKKILPQVFVDGSYKYLPFSLCINLIDSYY